MKALVVGLGSAGRRHARNWAALGLGEVLVYRATEAPQAEPLGVEVRMFRDFQEALAEKPDLVIVSNPTSLHVVTARVAVQAGCHVLVEKPLGSTMDGVSDLVTEAESGQRHIMVGYQLRFHPKLARLRELLLGGEIGRPLSVRAEMGEWLPGWHPDEDYRQAYSARRELGGGPVLTFSHELDTVCWLLGAPRAATCMTTRASSLEVDTEDVAEVLLRFGDGALCAVHVDYVRRPPRRLVEVVGEDGILRWEYDENRLLVYAPATRQWRVEEGDPDFVRNDLFLAELRAVVARLGGEPSEPLADGAQGAAILAISLAALESAESGRTITFDTSGEVADWLSTLGKPSRTSFASTAA